MLRDLEILKLDYTAANADYRITETHKVADLNGRVLIPFEGPFYARNLVVRGDGAPLTIETDYVLEDHFTELELMTGKKVIGSLRFSTRIQTDYKEIKIVYQKVGEFIISREFLIKSLETILDNDKPIDWLTQVFGKPDTYPPAFHYHDITKSDEIVGFHDLMMLFKFATGQVKVDGLTIWNELKAVEEKAYKVLNDTYTTLWNKMFSHIMNVNKPHPMTKAELGLGDHPNFETATKEEDQDAAFYEYNETANGKLILRDDAISTPAGVKAAIENFEQNTDGFVRQGDLPFSYYGSGFYLPPPIKGSFEGLGTDIGTAAICLEANGVVTALARSYDSKVKSLYYYYNNDIYNNIGAFTFSGVKYTHPVIEADNSELLKQYQAAHNGSSDGYVPLEANHVVSGSSGLILCIGDYEKNKYYIGLGNNTLDSNSHILKRINVGNFDDTAEGNVFDPFFSTIMLIGDYVYFVAQTSRWPSTTPESAKFGTKNAYLRLCMIYRANKADLVDQNKTDITFVKQSINYQDVEGDWHYKQDTIDFCPMVSGVTSSGEPYIKSMFVDYTNAPDPEFIDIHYSYRHQWVFKENPDNKNIASIRHFTGVQHWYYGVRTVGENIFGAIPMTFDTRTNTLSIDGSWFKIGYDITSGDITVPDGKIFNAWYNYSLGNICAHFDEVNATWIDKLGIATIGTVVRALPFQPYFYYGKNKATKGITDQWEAFNEDYSVTPVFGSANIPLESPFGFASIPATMQDAWMYNGSVQSAPIEIFRSLNNSSLLDVFYRVAEDSNYVKRDDLKFPYIGKDVYARNPNSRFGKVRVAGDTDGANSRFLPCVNYPVKNALSSQHGMFTIGSKYYNGNYPRVYNPFYAATLNESVDGGHAMDANGGFYLDTVGTYTLDEENSVLTVTPNSSYRLYINKTFWRGLMTAMLGSDDSVATANGLGGTGEYYVTICVANSISGGTLPVSFALMYYHKVSTDPNVAKMTYMKAVMFDWSSSGNDSNGYKIATLGTVKQIGTSEFENMNRGTDGRWGGINLAHQYPTVRPTLQVSGTDRNNMDVWFSCGIQMGTVGGSNTPNFRYTVVNGVATFSPFWGGIYTMGSTNGTYQALYNGGLQQTVIGTLSGGAAYYTDRGDGTYTLVEAVFVKGNWTLFISTDLTVMFNGSNKELKSRNYSLDQLGIDPANKTFYLYAVSGKTQGYYDLSLSEKTASPYHLLVATIKTNAVGIETITTQQSFAISGFTITAGNKGGSIPSTTGTFPETGDFEAVFKEDLFDTSKYN